MNQVYAKKIPQLLILLLISISPWSSYSALADGIGYNPATRQGQINVRGLRRIGIIQDAMIYLKAGERLKLDIQQVYTFSAGTTTTPQNFSVQIFSPQGLYDSYSVPVIAQNLYTPAATENNYLTTNITAAQEGIWLVRLNTINNKVIWRWDLNALTTGGSTLADRIGGRVFTETLIMAQTGDYTTYVDQFSLQHVNNLGHRFVSTFYKFNGIDSQITTNAFGVTLPGQCAPAYESVSYPYSLNNCGHNYKQFFVAPAADLPETTNRWDETTNATTQDWLLPALVTPVVNIGTPTFTSQGTAATPLKGTFTIPISGYTEIATLLIDANSNGNYADPEDRSIPFLAGNTVPFDGLDGLGNAIACGSTVNAKVLIDKAGEIHIVLNDVEGFGGLTVTRLNGIGAPSSTLYWNDTELDTVDPAFDPTIANRDGRAGINSDVPGGVHGWTYPAAGPSHSWGNNRYIDNWTALPLGSAEKSMIVTAPTCESLPVRLVSFDGSQTSSAVQLKWTTAMEENTDKFNIERSVNAEVWKTIGSVPASEESGRLIRYQFNDLFPESGTSYYRLKMLDKDGKYTYSRTISLVRSESSACVYPNPVSEKLYVRNGTGKKGVTLSLYDLNNHKIAETNNTEEGLNVSNISPGFYLAYIIQEDGRKTVNKVLIVR